jgi:hypothetical protein
MPVDNDLPSSKDPESKSRPPSLMRNYISFVGISIVVASVACVTLLFLMEIASHGDNPYLGILTYIIFPSILLFGLGIVGTGMLLERRRRRRYTPEEVSAYPKLDLNDPHMRRRFLVFLVLTFFFIAVSAFGSYRAFEYTESVAFCGQTCHTVMKPEFTAYLAGSHARVRCVDCHVGEGADWYVRSKLSGAYQLYSVTFNKYSRPIQTPVHNLRPAPETCEQCHWPEKFFGAQMKVFNRFGNDEKNTLRQTRMLINVGGGSDRTGKVEGIHWHMNIANEISYFATDEKRQNIPWVRMVDRSGNVTEFTDRRVQVTDQLKAATPPRKMDCVDCHNRPAHVYLAPDVAMDQALAAGIMDVSLPFLRRQAVELLSGNYETTEQALAAIDTNLHEFYRANYGPIYLEKQEAIKQAVTQVQEIYQTYMFPEMKTDWRTHPNNVGHMNSSGCFRCHDGEHFSKSGKMISNDCNVCHTTIYDSEAPPASNMRTGAYVHPVDLGSLSDRQCSTCHSPDRPFKHPVDLGDISRFQCAECHKRKPEFNGFARSRPPGFGRG